MTDATTTWTPTDTELRASLAELGASSSAIDAYLMQLGSAAEGATRLCTRQETGNTCPCGGVPGIGTEYEVTCTASDGTTTTTSVCKCR